MINFLTLLLILAIWGDSISTYLVLTEVPGGQEANPLVVPFINLLGPGPAMALLGVVRAAGAMWLRSMASADKLKNRLVLAGFGFALLITLFANLNNWAIWWYLSV